jgi:hypothetical protein
LAGLRCRAALIKAHKRSDVRGKAENIASLVLFKWGGAAAPPYRPLANCFANRIAEIILEGFAVPRPAIS